MEGISKCTYPVYAHGKGTRRWMDVAVHLNAGNGVVETLNFGPFSLQFGEGLGGE